VLLDIETLLKEQRLEITWLYETQNTVSSYGAADHANFIEKQYKKCVVIFIGHIGHISSEIFMYFELFVNRLCCS
jgi:hypothetical protein